MNPVNLAIKSLVVVQRWFVSWVPATGPPGRVVLLDFWPAVFVPMAAALFAFERVVLLRCVLYVPFLCPSPSFSSCAFGDWNIDIVDFFLQ